MNEVELVLCPWCKRESRLEREHECPNCGGPIVLSIERQHPDAPPPAPRAVPAHYKKHVAGFTSDFMTLFGLIWGLVGTVFFVVGLFLFTVFVLLGVIFTILGAIFGGVGWYLVFLGISNGRRRVALLETGTPVRGKIVSVERDPTIRKNGRYAYVIDYEYSVDGEHYGDSARGFDPRHADRRPGDPVWVVVDPDDKSRSVPFPPFA